MNTFFIAGEQRSGTTLLSVILSKHSCIDLDGFSIGFRLVSCFSKFYPQVLPYNLSHSREEIQAWLIEQDYKGRLAELIDPKNASKLPTARALIAEGIKERLAKNNKRVFGDKSPVIQYFMPDILTLIPEAKFIHIVRDGRAVAHSKNRRAHKNLQLAAQEWVDGNVLGLSNQAIVGKEVYHIVKYEDLVQDPGTVVKGICDFLGVSFEPEMIGEEGSSNDDSSYVKSSFDTDKIDSYKSELSKGQLRKLERIQAPLLLKFGYELSHPMPTGQFKQLSIAKRIRLNQADNFKQLLIGRRIGMRNRQNIEVRVPFVTRLKSFTLELARDLLPERAFKRLFRRRWIKEVYLKK